MLASEIRANARRALQGKWGKGVLIVLTYLLIMLGISWILTKLSFVGEIIDIIISVPISYGIMTSFIKLKRGEEVKYTGFLSEGFSKFGRIWGVFGHTLLKMVVPVILIIVCSILNVSSKIMIMDASMSSGRVLALLTIIGTMVSVIYAIVKGLLYSLTNYILYDNPNMTSKEIVEESERLMMGNRWNYVWLTLSFIGWLILCIFTFYIGAFWLVPYVSVSTVYFYEALAGKNSNEVVVEETNDNPISE
jgi:uncharacterized membrane protein